MIRLEKVSRTFQDGAKRLEILHDLDWSLEEGQSIAVMGRSGSGKSTLLNILGGLDRAYEGKVFFDEKELKQLNDRQLAQLRNQKLGYIFQSFHLLDQLTCEENVMLPSWFADISQEKALQRAKELLARVGLEHKIGTRPQRLSGGEKQRVAIARALMMEPALLLCDEPTGNLDESTGEEILQLFQSLQKEDRLTLILVTHETRTAEIADRIYVLQQGKLIEGKLKDGHAVPLDA
ncbi:MAG: ABC transporter ATP-binding protein [Myxococcales bacterium]|nr:ABC transporter ATP-binding protein [Myxococcales bacterium]